MTPSRKHVFYAGNVQGVGFRYTACRVADRFDVTGFVRNLPDGRVEIVAEGASAELDAFLADLADAMAGCIRRTELHEEPPTGAFSSFTVRY